MLTALQPTRLRVRSFTFKVKDDYPVFLGNAIPLARESLDLAMDLGLKVGHNLRDGSDNTLLGLIVTIALTLTPSAKAEQIVFERIEIVSDGFFQFPGALIEDTNLEQLVHNCFLILYGAIRGQLQVLTALVPGSFIVIPGVDLMAMMRNTVTTSDNLERIKSEILASIGPVQPKPAKRKPKVKAH